MKSKKNKHKSVKTNRYGVDQNVRLTVLQTVSGVGGKNRDSVSNAQSSQYYTKYYYLED